MVVVGWVPNPRYLEHGPTIETVERSPRLSQRAGQLARELAPQPLVPPLRVPDGGALQVASTLSWAQDLYGGAGRRAATAGELRDRRCGLVFAGGVPASGVAVTSLAIATGRRPAPHCPSRLRGPQQLQPATNPAATRADQTADHRDQEATVGCHSFEPNRLASRRPQERLNQDLQQETDEMRADSPIVTAAAATTAMVAASAAYPKVRSRLPGTNLQRCGAGLIWRATASRDGSTTLGQSGHTRFGSVVRGRS